MPKIYMFLYDTHIDTCPHTQYEFWVITIQNIRVTDWAWKTREQAVTRDSQDSDRDGCQGKKWGGDTGTVGFGV